MTHPLPPARLADLLTASTASLLAELAVLGEDGASFRPAPGEWCAKEVVGHLVAADRRGFGGRVRAILGGEELAGWDPAGVAAAREDHLRTVAEVAAELEASRADGIALLRSLTVDDLAATGVHPDIGEVAVADIIQEWVYHDRDHLQQMLENTRRLVWPHMGATQRFSELDAAE